MGQRLRTLPLRATDWLYHRCEDTESPLPLAVFRILFSVVSLAEVSQLLYHYRFYFDEYGTRSLSISFLPILLLWLASLLLLLVGFQTRYAAVANYLCAVHILSTFGKYHYHWDFPTVAISFLLIFLPMHRALSVDSWLDNWGSNPGQTTSPHTARIHRELLLLVGLGLVYADSAIFKLNSDMWLSGLGVWLPASLPNMRWTAASWFLDIKILSLGLCYLTMTFEVIFIFTFWWQRAWPVLFIVGIGLHLGILLAFPIPLFALGCLSLYALLIPGSWYQKVFTKAWTPRPARSNHGQTPVLAKGARSTTTAPEGRTRVKLVPAAVSLYLVAIVGTQLLMSADKAADVLYRLTGLRLVADEQLDFHPPGTTHFLGISPHPVFLDGHFTDYEHYYSLRRVLPDGSLSPPLFYDERGLAAKANRGRRWVWWTFRANRPGATSRNRELGFLQAISPWIRHAQAPELGWEEPLRFMLVRKPQEVPKEWQSGHLAQQLKRPWQTLYEVRWQNGRGLIPSEHSTGAN